MDMSGDDIELPWTYVGLGVEQQLLATGIAVPHHIFLGPQPVVMKHRDWPNLGAHTCPSARHGSL